MVSSRKRIRFHLMGHLDRERQNLTLRIQTAENKTYTQPAVVLPPFVPFAQAFSTVITTALTGSLYYIAASPKGPVLQSRFGREDPKNLFAVYNDG
ncbi:hypothetical protein RND81_06G072100 [Saponaria officinalis]|uniref:Uncharacterized protein n=1 Tax=Saponaria officinalis TaxID=3572 RepID=A0AAW1K703_SAPOF